MNPFLGEETMQCNPPSWKCLPGYPTSRNLSSLKEVVDDYISKRRPDVEHEFECVRSTNSAEQLFHRAAHAIQSDGKRNSHHYRKPTSLLKRVHAIISSYQKEILGLSSFNEVYDFLERTIGGFSGISELYLYDTSLTLCVYQSIFPTKIYLHSGTRKGARVLGLPYKRKFIEPNQVPVEFQVLKPLEIEDVFCIYKDVLKRIVRKRKQI